MYKKPENELLIFIFFFCIKGTIMDMTNLCRVINDNRYCIEKTVQGFIKTNAFNVTQQ